MWYDGLSDTEIRRRVWSDYIDQLEWIDRESADEELWEVYSNIDNAVWEKYEISDFIDVLGKKNNNLPVALVASIQEDRLWDTTKEEFMDAYLPEALEYWEGDRDWFIKSMETHWYESSIWKNWDAAGKLYDQYTK